MLLCFVVHILSCFHLLAGFFSHYLVLQFHICWVLHATSLFVIIKFPYKFRSLKKSTKLKYIHISCVIAGLVIPLLCALIPMMHAAGGNSVGRVGYVMITTDSLSCLPSDSNVVFYTSVLPSLLLVECGIALLIVTIWLIHKVIIVMLEYLIQIDNKFNNNTG